MKVFFNSIYAQRTRNMNENMQVYHERKFAHSRLMKLILVSNFELFYSVSVSQSSKEC